MPTWITAEASIDHEKPRFAVHTTIEVDAPPEVVFKHFVSFRELPPRIVTPDPDGVWQVCMRLVLGSEVAPAGGRIRKPVAYAT